MQTGNKPDADALLFQVYQHPDYIVPSVICQSLLRASDESGRARFYAGSNKKCTYHGASNNVTTYTLDPNLYKASLKHEKERTFLLLHCLLTKPILNVVHVNYSGSDLEGVYE